MKQTMPKRIRALPKLANGKSGGIFLIDLALALVVSTILLISQMSAVSEAVNDSLATATGQYMVALQAGVNNYVNANETAIQSGTAIAGFGNSLQPTIPELLSANYLPLGFSNTSPLGLSFVNKLKLIGTCPGSNCSVSGLSVSTIPYQDATGVIRNDLLAVAVAKIGNDGSQSMAGSGGKMTGYGGGYSLPASSFNTVDGIIGIRIGDNSGLNSLLSQYYKVDGSRVLTGPMNANNQNINNVNTLQASNIQASTSVSISGTATPGSACALTDSSKLMTSSNGDGLVICNNSLWELVGNAVSGITPGGACSVNNQFGTDATGVGYVCNGIFWSSLSNYANPGDACAPKGKVAISKATLEQLVCMNGQYIKMSSLIPSNVSVSNHLIVSDGMVVNKPNCDSGGTPNYSLTLVQTSVDVSIAPPFQSTYVAAQNNGPSWTILLRLKKAAADGGGEVSGNGYGLSAVMTLECSY